MNTYPVIGSFWCRKNYDPTLGSFLKYTVIAITNVAHESPNHPPQVVYQGDNGHWWSLPLDNWPGALVPVIPITSHEQTTNGEG